MNLGDERYTDLNLEEERRKPPFHSMPNQSHDTQNPPPLDSEKNHGFRPSYSFPGNTIGTGTVPSNSVKESRCVAIVIES